MDDTGAVAVRTSTTLPDVELPAASRPGESPSSSATPAAGSGRGAREEFDRLMEGFRARLEGEIAALLAAKRAAAEAASGVEPAPASGEALAPGVPGVAGMPGVAGAAGAPGAAAVAGAPEAKAAGAWRPAGPAAPAGLAELPPLAALVDGVAHLMVQGGKRLRPALVYYTYRACGGRSEARALPLALATELLHTYLLIHDDIMDHAGVRRGQPAAHVRFRDLHRASGLRGDAEDFGRSVAILLGDLAHTYAVELFTGALTSGAGSGGEAAAAAPMPQRRQAELSRCFAEMCEEVIGGQYLEYLLAHRGLAAQQPADDATDDLAASLSNAAHPAHPATTAREAELLRVLRLKSGRYTAERPIQLGALLAGAPPEVLAELSRYGTAVGEAFQLQDDLLGVFGDPATVGKPVGDDLREGKFTLLIHHALVHGSPADRRLIAAALGNAALDAADLARVQLALERSGARRAVTAMIAERLATARQALAALAALAPERFAVAGAGAGRSAATDPIHPADPEDSAPTAPGAPTAPTAGCDGPRFLSGLLDYLGERER
jgi:geranylgeranyl diphosphate synthase type I